MRCDYDFFYVDNNANNGRDWIVFLHGFGGSSKMWVRQIRLLKSKFNLCAVTLPGHGDNTSVLDTNSNTLYKDIAAMILRDLKEKGISEAYLISVSMGTLVANEILLADSGFVKKSLLTGAVCGASKFVYTQAKLLAKLAPILPYKFMVNCCIGLLFPKSSHKRVRIFLKKECLRLKKEECKKWFLSFLENINQVKSVTLDPKKCVLVVGDEDFIFKKGIIALASRCHIKLHTIKQCGHVCSLHKWREYNSILLSFLSATEPCSI